MGNKVGPQYLLSSGQSFQKGTYHEPIEEYLSSFGNITNFGLLDYKKEKWDFEKEGVRKISSFVHKEEFKAPEPADYMSKRYLLPLEKSSVAKNINVLDLERKRKRNGTNPSTILMRPSRYSNRVLVGFWVNDSAQHTPDKLAKPQYTKSYKDNFGLRVKGVEA
ncbi:hypothetical protein MTP99_016221 [Tenebrio molitor]|nr:hypothetical protein MTP99_016221 [Tenebrio molitor]